MTHIDRVNMRFQLNQNPAQISDTLKALLNTDGVTSAVADAGPDNNFTVAVTFDNDADQRAAKQIARVLRVEQLNDLSDARFNHSSN